MTPERLEDFRRELERLCRNHGVRRTLEGYSALVGAHCDPGNAGVDFPIFGRRGMPFGEKLQRRSGPR